MPLAARRPDDNLPALPLLRPGRGDRPPLLPGASRARVRQAVCEGGMKLAARPFSEHALQTMVCEYMVRAVRPELHWTAIPNGGKRDLRTAVKLKTEGVRRGTPDIVVLLPDGRVGWLE